MFVKNSILHNINYSAESMREIFDFQLLSKYPSALEKNTESVRHTSDKSDIYKTLLFKMRNVAKTVKTLKETKLQKKPRIAFCGYAPFKQENNGNVSLVQHDNSFYFKGLATCSNFWRCPVCALKISEKKKSILKDLYTAHNKEKKLMGFLTLTIRHSKADTLKQTLDKLLANYKSFQNQRFFSRHKKDNNYLGQVKTLEITWTENGGWHPHLHLLFFYDNNNSDDVTIFQKKVISNWYKYKDNNSLLKCQHQDIVKGNIEDYLAKLDIVSEMTKGNIKETKGLTPFTALAKLSLNDYQNSNEKNLLYGIYQNYIEHTQGRAFVYISTKLKQLYDIQDINLTDEEITSQEQPAIEVLKFSPAIWRLVCKHNLQPLICIKFKENNIDAVFDLLNYFDDFRYMYVQIIDDIPIITNEVWNN